MFASMNIAFNIAKRYLTGKKSINAINIITGISVLGISIGTAALILILSVFNGFEELLQKSFNAFNPEIKIVPAKGKFFVADSSFLAKLESIKGIDSYSGILEEIAYFEYDNNSAVGIIKGVDKNYNKVNSIDSTIIEGAYRLGGKDVQYGIIGTGLASKLAVNMQDKLTPVRIYILKAKTTPSLNNFYKRAEILPAGRFASQSEADMRYIIVSLDLAKYLTGKTDRLSGIEIKTTGDVAGVEAALKKAFGDRFIVKNRYEQNAELLKIMNMEKWISYAIVFLTLFLVAFNMVGSLWMIVLDKKKDISLLQSMGATKKMIKSIFVIEGILIAVAGILTGTVIALIFYFIQKKYGIIGIPEGFIIEAYPIKLKFWDFIIVYITVLLIGVLVSILPAYRAGKIPAFIREE